tara:strand:- start:2031 stop:3035 length:1005 start_codon:yes stop_codon:yes gene_type:complete
MIGLNLDDIVSKIKEEKGLSEEEIKQGISQKVNKLGGLVSEEGAAHILANELGIDLMESIRKHGLKIAKLKPGMRVGVIGKVLKLYEVRSFNKDGRSGKVGSFLIGDDTGLVRIVLWDAALISKMESGEIAPDVIVKVENGAAKENNGYMEMHLGGYSNLILNPEGVKEVNVIEKNVPDSGVGTNFEIRKLDAVEVGENVTVYGTIVQLFDPRFYEGCSECGKKVVDGKCEAHAAGVAKKIPILNFFIDDGFGGMRATAFREQAAKILDMDEAAVENLADDPDKFESVKQNILGSQLVLSGRINQNQMFDRKEFIVRMVHEVDAKEILAKLQIK